MLFDPETFQNVNLNGDKYTPEVIEKIKELEFQQALAESTQEAINIMKSMMKAPSLVKEFVSTPSGPGWISTWYKEMEPMLSSKDTSSITFTQDGVEDFTIKVRGYSAQDAINSAYQMLVDVANKFDVALPCHRGKAEAPNETSSLPSLVKPQASAFISPSDYYKAINEYYVEMGKIAVRQSDACTKTPQPHSEINANGIVSYDPSNYSVQVGDFPTNMNYYRIGFGAVSDGTIWHTPTTTTTGTWTSPIPDFSAQLWYSNPDTADTQPLVEKQNAWYWLEQGKSCTNGYYTIQPTDINTLRVYNESNGGLAMVSAMTSKEDRYKELKEFSYELQDISVLEKDTMALDNAEWEAAI